MTSQTRFRIVPAFSARALLQLTLSLFLVAALLVSSGFAATKKLDRDRTASDEWNDSRPMSASLLSTGSSVPSGGGNLTLSQGGAPGGILSLPPSSPDNWNGGPGNWSNTGNRRARIQQRRDH